MSDAADIERMVRQAANATAAVAEWVEEHGARDRLIGRLAADRISSAAIRLQRLSHAAARRPALAVIGSDADQGSPILAALTGHVDGQLVVGSAEVRLPVAGGLMPEGDKTGPALVLRYAPPAGDAIANDHAVNRIMGVAPTRPTRATAAGVRIEILSYADLITIFGRAYLSHLRGDVRLPLREALTAALAEEQSAEPGAAVEPGLSRNDVDDIRLRLERSFAGHPHLELLSSTGFWATFSQLAPRASRASRRRLSSFVWGGLADFDAYFAVLSEALDSLSHASEIICAADAIAHAADGVIETVHPASVLAASTMLNWDGDGQSVEVRTRHSGALQIRRAVIAALASEIVVRPQAGSNVRNRDHDVLQIPLPRMSVPPRIPGRAGTGAVALSGQARAGWLATAIVEAKAIHLAERVVDRRDADALVAIVAPEHPLPLSITPVLSRWVYYAAGSTPRERDGNGDVFVLAAISDPHSSASDTPPTWSALDRFRGALTAECAWLGEWGQGTPFDRIVLLRSNGTKAPAERGRELVTAGRALTRSGNTELARTSLDKTLLRRATLTLDEALAADDGGLRYLVQTTSGINLRRLRNRQISREAHQASRCLARAMRRAYLPAPSDADNDWRRRATYEAQAWLRTHARNNTLGRLMHALLPHEQSIADRMLSAFPQFGPQFGPQSSAQSPAQSGTAADAGSATTGASGHETSGHETSGHETSGQESSGQESSGTMPPVATVDEPMADDTALDNLARRASSRAMESWLDGLLSWAASDASTSLIAGATPDLEHLVDELTISAVRADLTGRIAQAARRVLSSAGGRPELTCPRIAREAAEIIARHVSECGFDAAWSTKRPHRPGALGAPLFERAAGVASGSGVAVAARIADQYAEDWCEAFPIMVEENIASARIVRNDERDMRELADVAAQLETIGRGSVT